VTRRGYTGFPVRM